MTPLLLSLSPFSLPAPSERHCKADIFSRPLISKKQRIVPQSVDLPSVPVSLP